jgi:branched-chain amino acid transport system substrate-binding protein
MIGSLKNTFNAAIITVASMLSAQAAEIKIGVVWPITGLYASDGQDMTNVVKLALSEINAKGGVLGNTVTAVSADDACDPQQAVTAAAKLLSEGVIGIVGGFCSGSTLPTLKLYGDAGLPYIIIAANSTKLVAANPGNAFLINSTGDAQVATALALFKKKGFKTLAIVDEGDAYSSDLSQLTAEEFPKVGGQVVGKDRVVLGEQDFSVLVTNLKAKNPDAIFWTAQHADGALLTKQLRQTGYKGAIVLGDGSLNPEYLQIAGSAANGAYIFSPPVIEFLPEARKYIETYKAAYHRDPGAYSALGYDGVRLMADAIARAGSTDKQKIIEALKASDFKGLAGEIKFSSKNTLDHSNFSVLVAEGGKWVLAK